MNLNDKPKFAVLVNNVYAFYRQDSSEFAIGVWWEACKGFDFDAVRGALNRHAVNPDNGQFLPKPADIVKLLQGSTLDASMVAWSKVDKAVRQIGTYETVVFDDPIIHSVLQDMGGWVPVGSKGEDEWPFVAKEFQTRYRGYCIQGGPGEYPKRMIGIAEAQNVQNGFKSNPPVLIGDSRAAQSVIAGGSDAPKIGFERQLIRETVAHLEMDRDGQQ